MSLKIVCFLFLLLLTSFVNEVTSKNHDGGWDISISATIGVIPDPKDYSCPFKNNSNPNPWHWRGANIGGWLVLEPWITPSLFYQFLGKAKDEFALDSFTFCKVLGDEEANRQLRKHWNAWVTEQYIMDLAEMGVDTIRVPVADWMYVPYPPYVHCWDGSLDVLNNLLEWCEKHHINVILDVHTEVFSQNPFDNSGRADKIIWTSNNTYIHDYEANWFGQFDNITQEYQSMNTTHMMHALNVVQKLIDHYKNVPSVIGIEPINEPWAPVPIKHLKRFYYNVYSMVQTQVPRWITLLHDSFRLSVDIWGGFLLNCPNFAMDTHIYLAWSDVQPHWVYQNAACNNAVAIRNMEAAGLPVVVGEWSLATNNCAMWLNGFNDNLPGFPKVQCKRIPCPQSYMYNKEDENSPYGVSGTIPKSILENEYFRTHPIGPFGAGDSGDNQSFIINGQCVTEPNFAASDSLDDFITNAIAKGMLSAYDSHGHGQFFWNFRTELEDRWSFADAVRNNWIPRYSEPNWDDGIAEACTIGARLPIYNESTLVAPPPHVSIFRQNTTIIPLLICISVIIGSIVLYQNPLKKEREDGYLEIENEVSLYNEDGIPLNTHRL